MEDGIARLPGEVVYAFGTGRSNADLPAGWSTATSPAPFATRVTHNIGHTNYVAVATPRPSTSAPGDPHFTSISVAANHFDVRHFKLDSGSWIHSGLGFECIVIDLGAP